MRRWHAGINMIIRFIRGTRSHDFHAGDRRISAGRGGPSAPIKSRYNGRKMKERERKKKRKKKERRNTQKKKRKRNLDADRSILEYILFLTVVRESVHCNYDIITRCRTKAESLISLSKNLGERSKNLSLRIDQLLAFHVILVTIWLCLLASISWKFINFSPLSLSYDLIRYFFQNPLSRSELGKWMNESRKRQREKEREP